MSKRRMFSPNIVESDAFLDMPLTSQSLYFHLGMNADDDGFVNPKRIMRMIGASDDDLKILLAKRYLLGFESGVVVVKHWNLNNLIRIDRYTATTYTKEKNTLGKNEYGAYTELHRLTDVVGQKNTNGKPKDIPKVNPGKVRLGKVSIGKDNISTNVDTAEPESFGNSEINELFEYWEEMTGNKITANTTKNRYACNNLLKKHGADNLKRMIGGVAYSHGEKYAPSIANFIQLQAKWDDLVVWGKKHKTTKTRGFTVQ